MGMRHLDPDVFVPPSPGEDFRYKGVVKSYNELKGWGFISCPETHKKFGCDVFLTRGEVRGIQLGGRVEFSVRQKGPQGQPHAVNTAPLDKPEPFKIAYDSPIYASTLKSYWNDRGFGFLNQVTAENARMLDVQPQLTDIFLHQYYLPWQAKIGELYYYQLAMVDAKPQGRFLINSQEARFGALLLDSESKTRAVVRQAAQGPFDLPIAAPRAEYDSAHGCAARELREKADIEVPLDADSPYVQIGNYCLYIATVPRSEIGPGYMWLDPSGAEGSLGMPNQIFRAVQQFVVAPPIQIPEGAKVQPKEAWEDEWEVLS
jgi:cold shock CspA family protein